MSHDVPRTRLARAAAEKALVRIVHHYGERRSSSCSVVWFESSSVREVGSATREPLTSMYKLTLKSSPVQSTPHGLRVHCVTRSSRRRETVWRWTHAGVVRETAKAVVTFELLADLDYAPAESIVTFDTCEALGAANLRGTGFTTREVVIRTLTARVGGVRHTVEINVAGLAGFLLAKTAAAHARRMPKDWYDLAFVLIDNDEGGPRRPRRW